MKKTLLKLLSSALACAMVLSMTACGGSGTPSGSVGTASASGTTANNGGAEPYTVKLMYSTMMTIPSEEAQKEVEDAINAYLKEKGYDFAFDMEVANLFEYGTTVPLALSSGEKMDIIIGAAPNMNMQDMVNNGYLLPLNDYIDNEMKGIKDMEEDWLTCGTIGDTLYTVPVHKGWALTWKYIYDKSYVDGIGYDMSKVKDFDSLLDLFAALKEAYPDKVIEADTSRYPTLFNDLYDTSLVGAYFATVGDDPTLVNYFETEAFRKACEYAYEFRQKGYSSAEGSTNTLNADALVNSGMSIGTTMSHGQTAESIGKTFTTSNTYGGTFDSVEIAPTDMATMSLNYGLAYTSENPAAAATMLNLLWTDEYIINTLIYGLEGKSYVWNADHTSIGYPEGLDADSVPYTTMLNCGAFSDQFKMYPFEGNSTAEDLEYMKANLEKIRYCPLFGFTPNAEKVSTQSAAVSNVYNQYFKALSYGDIDPEVYLPEFLSSLEAAGINDMLAEYQSQADAWQQAQ